MANPVIMLLSAAIFGYFGFLSGMTPFGPSGEFVFMFALLLWTLRIGCVSFALAALLTFASPFIGNLFFCITGLLTAIAFVVLGVMDVLDPVYIAALPPVLAFIFAAWNGYGAWAGLQEIVSKRPQASAS